MSGDSPSKRDRTFLSKSQSTPSRSQKIWNEFGLGLGLEPELWLKLEEEEEEVNLAKWVVVIGRRRSDDVDLAREKVRTICRLMRRLCDLNLKIYNQLKNYNQSSDRQPGKKQCKT